MNNKPTINERISKLYNKIQACSLKEHNQDWTGYTLDFKMKYPDAKAEILSIAEQYHQEKLSESRNTYRRGLLSRGWNCYMGFRTGQWRYALKKVGRLLWPC